MSQVPFSYPLLQIFINIKSGSKQMVAGNLPFVILNLMIIKKYTSYVYPIVYVKYINTSIFFSKLNFRNKCDISSPFIIL